MGGNSISGNGNIGNVAGDQNYISGSFQNMTGAEHQKALDLAQATGPREYNLIKNLSINPGALFDAPVDVIRNVSAILRRVLGA